MGSLLLTLLLLFTARDAKADPLRVVTYNVKLGDALIAERKTPAPWNQAISMKEAFRREPALSKVDILGTQEICSDEGGWQLDYFEELIRSQHEGRAWRAFARSDEKSSIMCQRGEAIFSRYPITGSGRLELPN